MTKITIFSGFLGAGKTTLIKKLIADGFAGEKLVLIENEFGEIGIDGGFLQDAGVQVTEMNSGCICCSLVGDFGKALEQVLADYAPDRIVIEPSGVGKLSDVIAAVQRLDAFAAGQVSLTGFAAVADAAKCRTYLKNFGEFYTDQVKHASAILLSRTANLAPEKLAESVALLRAQNADAPIVTTPWEALTGGQILAAIERENTLSAVVEALAQEQAAEHEHVHGNGHAHEHHDHGEDCACGHGYAHDHHDHGEDCACGHGHAHDHHEHSEDCACGHGHAHDHHDHGEDCACGHGHAHEHHDHDENCGCHGGPRDGHGHGEHCACGGHGKHHGQHHDHASHDHTGHHHADEVFSSFGAETPKSYSPNTLAEILTALDSGAYGTILRAKGIVPAQDGTWLHFDFVPEEQNIRTGTPDVTGRICVIGTQLNETALRNLFAL